MKYHAHSTRCWIRSTSINNKSIVSHSRMCMKSILLPFILHFMLGLNFKRNEWFLGLLPIVSVNCFDFLSLPSFLALAPILAISLASTTKNSSNASEYSDRTGDHTRRTIPVKTQHQHFSSISCAASCVLCLNIIHFFWALFCLFLHRILSLAHTFDWSHSVREKVNTEINIENANEQLIQHSIELFDTFDRVDFDRHI